MQPPRRRGSQSCDEEISLEQAFNSSSSFLSVLGASAVAFCHRHNTKKGSAAVRFAEPPPMVLLRSGVSRILFTPVGVDDHFSGIPVARDLKQPTRGEAPATPGAARAPCGV